jgi:phosphate transport system substrate-binding protein
VEYYNKHGESLAKEVKYVPLPPKAYTYNMESVGKMRLGTKFEGENKVGLTIEDLMKLEAKL